MDTPRATERNLMAATWTKAAKVRRAFKSGKKRRKDLVLTPRRAVIEAYVVLHELREAMARAGLSETDANGALVFLSEFQSSDSAYVIPLPAPERMPEPYATARRLEEQLGWRPIGLILHQRDHEAFTPADPKSGAYLWAQQWVISDRATKALLDARKLVANTKAGGAQDVDE